MRAFIQNHWERGGKQSDDLVWLLGAMNRETAIWPDGGPADPAMWRDWLSAVGEVRNLDLSAEAVKPARPAPDMD